MHGAPLDAIKLAAAALMLADHVNSAVVTTPELLAWRWDGWLSRSSASSLRVTSRAA